MADFNLPIDNLLFYTFNLCKELLPPGGYELCTVNERADGLLFYGDCEVEHLTDKSEPYPAFTKTEYILEEMQEFIKEGKKCHYES